MRRKRCILVAVAACAAVAVVTTANAANNSLGDQRAVHRDGTIAWVSGTTVELDFPSGAVETLAGSSGGYNQAGALAWSPGGRKLAFIRGTIHGGLALPDKFALFVSNANGQHLRRLLRCDNCLLSDWETTVSWSPDGSTIVVNDGLRLALVNVKTGSHRLAAGCPARSDVHPYAPAWSPDGSEIAFACGDSLYVATRTGTHAHSITTVPGNVQVGHLAWSPDGNTLAFDTPDSIYTVSADGSDLTTLHSGPAGNGPGFPAWSPDGTHILYVTTPETATQFFVEVWVMNADGTQNQRLYHSSQPLIDYTPALWSPDGKQIAFSIDTATSTESGLMIMNADGSGLRRIGDPMYEVNDFAWQARPLAARLLATSAGAANSSDKLLARKLVVAKSDLPTAMLDTGGGLRPGHCLPRRGFAISARATAPFWGTPFDGNVDSVAAVLTTRKEASAYYGAVAKAISACLVGQVRRSHVLLGSEKALPWPRFGDQSVAGRIPEDFKLASAGQHKYTLDWVVVRERRAVLVDDFTSPLGSNTGLFDWAKQEPRMVDHELARAFGS